MMDWRTALVIFAVVYYADGFSKYGRTCKDIGCLNSEVCVLAEDPCSFGHTSNCGTYPTCKKKSKVEGSHSEPGIPVAPQPTPARPQSPTRDFDSPPNYNPPAVPGGSNSPYGGNTAYGGSNSHGGGSPYGGSPYGGSNGGSSPYGGSNGGSSPYGGSNGGNSPYGGSNGGSSPYGGSNGGSSPYGGSNGGSSPYGGSNGGSSPYGGSNGGSNPYGGNPSYGGSNPSSGSKGTLDSIFNTISKYANGGRGTPGAGAGAGAGGTAGAGGPGLTDIFGNLLNNLNKNGGGLNNFFNTRPIQENPNYSSYSSNSRSSNAQTYPSSGYQPNYNQPPNQNKNYGQSNAHHSGAATHRPTYGWRVSVSVILTYLIHQYFVLSFIRN